MAGTVVPQVFWFVGLTSPYYNSDCDQITDWGGAPTADAEVYIQKSTGTSYGALSKKVSNATATHVFSLKDATDLSNTMIYVWILGGSVSQFDTRANGGIRIRIEDASLNWGEWYVAGKDYGYPGGWACLAVHTTVTDYYYTSATPPTKSAITKVGVVFKTIISAAKINCWWDALRYGTGLQIKAGTEAEPATIDNIVTWEETETNRTGVISRLEGTIFYQGKLWIGSTTAGESTYFKDTSEVIVFKDAAVPSDFYSIIFQGNSTGTTKIYFGSNVGGKGVSGLYIKAVNSSKRYAIDATNTNVGYFGLYGTTFYQARRIEFPAYDANKEVISCNFESCWEVYPNTSKIQYCNFIAPSGETPAVSVRMSSTSHNITNSVFIFCSRAIEITVAGPFTFNDLDFSGNTYDVLNNAGVAVTVNYDQYCSPAPSTYDPAGSSVTFQASVTLIVRKVKTGSEPASYVRCAIYKKSDMSEIMNKDADVADDQNPTYYKASQSYSQTGVIVVVRAREKGYLPFETELTIPSTGLDVTAVWLSDPNYNP